MARCSRLLVLLAGLGLLSCESDDESSIQVLVSDVEPGLEVRPDRIELRITTIDGAGGTPVDERLSVEPSYDPAGRLRPWSSLIRPATEGDRRVYRFRAVAFVGASEIVAAQARLTFLRGARLLLPLRFERACVRVACAADETCAAGACRDDYVPPCSLVLGTRPAVCDETSDDAAMDARIADVSVPLDLALADERARDGGASPDAQDSGDSGAVDPPMDLGMPPMDLGPPLLDLGMPPTDLGTPPMDLGPPIDCDDAMGCDDGDPCTEDSCVSGGCTRRALVCDDGNACTADACDSRTGSCVAATVAAGTSCGGSSVCCGPVCTDVAGADTSCGSCGVVCGPRSSCVSGRCVCDPGLQDCDAAPGCESDPRVDPAHCGRCAAACSGATPACLGGVCGACSTPSDCGDDGLGCTGPPTCTAGACSHPLLPGRCLVGGVCYADGDSSPSNVCRECDSAVSTTTFVPRMGAACDDGAYCTIGDACDAMGMCVGAGARNCADMLSCTTDSCSEPMDACLHPIAPGTCVIGGVCHGDGAANPANPCQQCQAAVSQTAWTPRTGSACDDGLYCMVGETCSSMGACGGGMARDCSDGLSCTADSCNEVMDACLRPTMAGTCLIDGVCYADGTLDPANPCRECEAATSQSMWTALPGGPCDDGLYCTVNETCGVMGMCGGATPRNCSDGLSCTNDSCNETADACVHLMIAGTCLIAGVCHAEGAVNPANECQICRPMTSSTAWSNVDDDTSCGPGGDDNCCGGVCRRASITSCENCTDVCGPGEICDCFSIPTGGCICLMP